MYHFNYFSSSFPGKLADGELINGPNKEAAALFYHSLHSDSFACLLLFQTIALLRFQPEIVSSLKRTQSYPSPQILINYRLLLQHESMNRAPTRAHGPRVVETPQACECGSTGHLLRWLRIVSQEVGMGTHQSPQRKPARSSEGVTSYATTTIETAEQHTAC